MKPVHNSEKLTSRLVSKMDIRTRNINHKKNDVMGYVILGVVPPWSIAKFISKSNSPSDIVMVFIIEINGDVKGERCTRGNNVT